MSDTSTETKERSYLDIEGDHFRAYTAIQSLSVVMQGFGGGAADLTDTDVQLIGYQLQYAGEDMKAIFDEMQDLYLAERKADKGVRS